MPDDKPKNAVSVEVHVPPLYLLALAFLVGVACADLGQAATTAACIGAMFMGLMGVYTQEEDGGDDEPPGPS